MFEEIDFLNGVDVDDDDDDAEDGGYVDAEDETKDDMIV